MIRRFAGAVGGAGAVPAAWLTPIVMPPMLNSADRATVPVLVAMV
jgi:hypothetical protein